jgi:hypothetical protein
VLVGTATLKVQGVSKYQPGKCARMVTELPTGESEICIDGWAWVRFKAVDFRDLKGKPHSVSSIVAAVHLVPEGEWLLVLEKLPAEEAAKFNAKYKVIERAPIQPIVCLEGSIEEYMHDETPAQKFTLNGRSSCYNARELSRK